MEITIKGLDKGKVLLSLWKHSHAQGMSFFGIQNVDLETATKDFNESRNKYFDYYNGKVIKCDLSGDSFDPYLYDRDCGHGAAERAVNSIR